MLLLAACLVTGGQAKRERVIHADEADVSTEMSAAIEQTDTSEPQLWSKEQAWNWYYRQPWLCGVNYIPAYAINYTAMWDKTTFSTKDIERELQLMEDLRMNCVRVVMQHAVYEDDPNYFIKTLDRFLSLCWRHHIKVMPIFFDDCSFGVNNDPVIGRQAEPLRGWYAWAWSPSPGYTLLVDENQHGRLERYVTDVLRRFAQDERILAWDLYNEPTGTSIPLAEHSMSLLRKVFQWARRVNPSQPITTGIWNGNKELEEFLTEHCDIITFHCYDNKENTTRWIDSMSAKGRPVICTEWMNRPRGSTFADLLLVFKEKHVGCMAWGLVNGKTQTDLPWGHRPEQGEYTGLWQHDLFRSDFAPYDEKEVQLIRQSTEQRSFNEVPDMLYGDVERKGIPFAKDPHVVRFDGRYLMYFSIPPYAGDAQFGWNIGIAESHDLVHWTKVGEITPEPGCDYEKKGLCAPCALVRDGQVHLFYQTYGNREHDAICHASSSDGLHFRRNPTNPIFHPTGTWTCGRAIDAEVYEFNGQYFLYFATRDPAFDVQMQGVATAPLHTDFNREDWKMACDGPILKPELPWEGKCIEGASIACHGETLYMFYAGAYNNAPQQVGVARSTDGIHWERLFDQPFLSSGSKDAWNSCESGHPHLFTDTDGRTYLFYQGNNDKGRSWLLSQQEVVWKKGRPYLKGL